MKITIGIPCYKDIESVKRLLFCLNKQVCDFKKDTEIIVVNDDVKQKIYKNEFYFLNLDFKVLNIKHAGVAQARNKIIKLAQGEIILFLDSDTRPTVDWLQKMIIFFKEHEEVSAVGGCVKPTQPSKGLVNEYYNITNRLEHPVVDRKTEKIVTIITANCGFKTDALRQIGGFDQKSFYLCPPGGEDMDLSFRLRQVGYTLFYAPKAVVFHEYPKDFSSIFTKYANYGKGVKVYCFARKINPKDIRQPKLTPFSFFIYNLKIFNKFIKSYKYFKNKQISALKCFIFSFFDCIMYLGHGYGYFLKK